MKAFIIADSGGTKTDWCKVDEDGKQACLHTCSYHPAQWSEEIAREQREFWKLHPEWLKIELYFFGAGCYQKERALWMKKILENLGFERVFASSDVHGAAWATLGNQPGWVAIMGTGSVLIEWDGSEVKQILGGLGHEVGDEGSAYRFGRMVVDRYQQGHLSKEQQTAFERCVDVQKIEASRSTKLEKSVFAGISKELNREACFSSLHSENIEQFILSFREHIPANTPLYFIGSYAWHNREELARILGKYDLSLAGCIEKPIGHLVEQSPFFVD